MLAGALSKRPRTSSQACERRVQVLHRTGQRGLGVSYLEGFRRAIATDYDFICQMDADLSHDPEYLPAMIEAAAKGADLVIGSRYLNGISVVNWPLRRIPVCYIDPAGEERSSWPGHPTLTMDWIEREREDRERAEGERQHGPQQVQRVAVRGVVADNLRIQFLRLCETPGMVMGLGFGEQPS